MFPSWSSLSSLSSLSVLSSVFPACPPQPALLLQPCRRCRCQSFCHFCLILPQFDLLRDSVHLYPIRYTPYAIRHACRTAAHIRGTGSCAACTPSSVMALCLAASSSLPTLPVLNTLAAALFAQQGSASCPALPSALPDSTLFCVHWPGLALPFTDCPPSFSHGKVTMQLESVQAAPKQR